MAARRCATNHAPINYPGDHRNAKCVVCGDETDFFTNMEPDEDWMDKVAALLEQQAGDDAPPVDIPVIDAKVRVCGDYLCIDSDKVYYALRKTNLPPRTLLQVGVQVFEILHWRREPRREYVVRSFSTTLSDDDLRRLSCRD